MELLLGVFTAFGLSASTGLNAYLPLLVVSLMARFTDWITLSQPWDTMESWWVIGVLAVLSTIEFFADKVPAVNHVNDAIQGFVRPAAGAIAFAASAKVITDVSPVLALILGLIVSGSVNAVKSLAVRPMVTATTGGVGNIPVSMAEDVISTFVSILAIVLPIFMMLFVLILIFITIKLLMKRSPSRRRY